MKRVTVLLTGCGAPGAPSIIKCLRKNGEREVRIVGVDMNENAAARTLVDAFYAVPAAENPSFIGRVLEVCQREGVEAVLPIVTRELEPFSAAKARFEEAGVMVSVMDPKPLHAANNKALLLSAMKEAGLPAPEFRTAHTADEVEAAIKELGYPERAVVVKPTFGNGSRGTRILDPKVSRYSLMFEQKPNSMYISFSGLMEVLREQSPPCEDNLGNNVPPPHTLPEMMVMEHLPGTEYTVDILAEQGRVLKSVCRRGTLVVNSIMMDSVIEQNKAALALCAEAVNLLKFDGSIGFDMKEDASGRPLVMEANPRLTAGVVACAISGVNFPYLAVKRLLREALPQTQVAEGTVMRRRNAEIFFGPEGGEIPW